MNEEEYALYRIFSDNKDDLKTQIATGSGIGMLAGAGGLGVASRHISNEAYKESAKELIDKHPKFSDDFIEKGYKRLAGKDEKWLKGIKDVSKNSSKEVQVEELLRTLDKNFDKAPESMKPWAEKMEKGLKKSKNFRNAAIATGLTGAGALGYGLYRHNKNKR